MSVALVNPYCSLADLQNELKNNDATKDDWFRTCINQASRWVDHYTNREFFGRDHRGETRIAGVMAPATGTEALKIDKARDWAFDDKLYLPWVARAVYRVTELGDALTEDTDWHAHEVGKPFPSSRLFRVGADWSIGDPPDDLLQVQAKFGYNQWTAKVGTLANLAVNALSNVFISQSGTSPDKHNARLYIKITATSPPVWTAQFYSDAGLTALVGQATGSGAQAGVTITEQNSSGYSGTLTMGTFTGTDNDGYVDTKTDVLDDSIVPTDLPGEIALAARLVAAAISGQYRKEVAGLDGSKTSILDNAIPKTVFQILGRQKPLLT